MVTHGYALVECVALAHARGVPRRQTLNFVTDIAESSVVEIAWITPQFHENAMNMLRSQLDKSYSLCDAVSFVLMRERGIYDALTTDHRFEQAGFRRLLPVDHR